MMKKLLIGMIVLAALAGCGSSAGSTPQPQTSPTPIVTPTPTSTPTTTPQGHISYSWAGALAPNGSTQTFARTVQTAGTPIPVQATLCDPRSADCRPNGSPGTDIDPTVTISDNATPAPTAAPTIAPPPGLGLVLQTSAPPAFTYQEQIPTQAGCGNITVTFANANGTVRSCAYQVFTIGCVQSLSNQPGGGYSTSVDAGYNLDTQSYVTDPSQADVYMTGQTCPGNFYATNLGPNDYEVHFPYGAVGLSQGDYTLATISPSQWANSMTQIEFNQAAYPVAPCGSQLNCLVLFKSASGNVNEMEITREGADGPNDPVFHGDWFTAAYATSAGGEFPQ